MCGTPDDDPSVHDVQFTEEQKEHFAQIRKATFYGYNCAHCDVRVTDHRTPIRRGQDNTFFCSFSCAREYFV